jgi:hypothetical protein
MEKNIWEKLDLSHEKLKTAFDYLIPQAENFKKATKGELEMRIDVSRAVIAGGDKENVTIYVVWLVAPKLGHFKKKLLNIVEFHNTGRFPVNMYSPLSEVRLEAVSEENFLEEVQKMLEHQSINNQIESLYRQSFQSDSAPS